MCGIAGWLGAVPEAERVALSVARRLAHRGPDAQGIKLFPQAALVHTRLSILDLSPTGAQPMPDEDERLWVVFNGEIYNHRELRKDLESKGHRFRGRSDTEVLPAIYRQYGPQGIERLRGMFAYAIYDPARAALFLGRDRFGIKPVFYSEGPATFAFASEIGALRQMPGIGSEYDAQALHDFAALFFIPAPATAFRDIRALEPGRYLQVSWADGSITASIHRYHRWSIAPDQSLGLDRAMSIYSEKLDRAVSQQLESDVPLGALLSGGIDSSLVAAAAQKVVSTPLRTFNVRMPDAEFDETWAAQEVAGKIGSQHETMDLQRGAGTYDAIVALLEASGQPFADTSVFAVRAVCRQMRKRVTVALSGDGGDEGFGGYDSFWQIEMLAALQALPPPLRALLSCLAAPLARLGSRASFSRSSFDRMVNGDHTAATHMVLSWVRDEEHARLCRGRDLLPVSRHFERQWTHELPAGASAIEQASAHLTEVWTRLILPSDFLFKVDIASMAESLEVRVPMLDEDLCAFGLTLPHDLKVLRRVGKVVPRHVAAQRLGPRIGWKRKHGFQAPIDRWVDEDFRPRLRDELLSSRSRLPEFFRPSSYRPMVEAFCEGRLLPGVTRAGLYNRVIMLLSAHLTLGSRVPAASS